jgi:hypothetical protein
VVEVIKARLLTKVCVRWFVCIFGLIFAVWPPAGNVMRIKRETQAFMNCFSSPVSRVAMFLYWLISLILVYGVAAFATYIIYQEAQHPSIENNANMLMAYNIWISITENQVFSIFFILDKPVVQ